MLENDRKKVNYYHGGHQGALFSVFDSLKKRTLSRETLARSKVSEREHDLTVIQFQIEYIRIYI